MNNEQLIEIIRAELNERGTNAYRFAKDSGLPDGAIRYVLKGRQPKLDRLVEICEALDLELHVGRSRTPEMVQNLNKNEFNSENPALVVPPEIVAALNLSEDASIEDALTAIEVLLDSRASDDLVALRDEIAALREAILHPATQSDNHESDDNDISYDQIAEAPALYSVSVQYDDLANDEALSAQNLPDGCSILVDRSRQRRHSGHIFVLLTVDGLAVKRLGKNGNGI